MKKWTNPELTNLAVENTNDDFLYDCMIDDAVGAEGLGGHGKPQKPPHRHCPVCGESSSSCDHVDWTPIVPSTPIPGVS